MFWVFEIGEVRRFGLIIEMKCCFRLILVINWNFGEMVEKGIFRCDLYYCINVVLVYILVFREWL